MSRNEQQYLDLCRRILDEGQRKDDRTGTGTLSVFGAQMRFDLQAGFPLLTTKRMPLRIIFEELRWLLSGDTDIKYLLDQNVHIWNADAYRDYKENGGELDYDCFVGMAREEGYDLGPIYSAQWRSWEGTRTLASIPNEIDQIANVIESIRTNPDSRRHIVSAWNVYDLEDMALPPCHVMFQFYVRDGKYLDCQLYQRSGDVFLGVPFNIASYALLTHIIADMTGYLPGEFIHTIGDAHIYTNHIEQVREQLTREPKELPALGLRVPPKEDPAQYTWDDVDLVGYDPHPPIKGKVSVG